MKKLTRLGLGMGLVLACTVGPGTANVRYDNDYYDYSILGAYGLVDNILNGYTPVTIPGHTAQGQPSPPAQASAGPQPHGIGWSELPEGGSTLSEPAAVPYGEGLLLFVRGLDNRIYWDFVTAKGGTGWRAEPCGGETLSGPAVVSYGERPLLVIRGLDNGIYWNQLLADGWTCWHELPGGGRTTAEPAAVVLQDALSVIVQRLDNHIDDNLFIRGWTGWMEVSGGGETASGVAATVVNGHVWYVVRGRDNRLYWNGW